MAEERLKIEQACPAEATACWASATCSAEVDAAMTSDQGPPAAGSQVLMDLVLCMESRDPCGECHTQCNGDATCDMACDGPGMPCDSGGAPGGDPCGECYMQCNGDYNCQMACDGPGMPCDSGSTGGSTGTASSTCMHRCHCGAPGMGGQGPFTMDDWYDSYSRNDGWHNGCCGSVSAAPPDTSTCPLVGIHSLDYDSLR